MTKGKAALPFRFDAADDEQQVPPLRYAPVGMTLLFGTDKRNSFFSNWGGPQAHDSSDRKTFPREAR
jgi:hypothetical protein